MRREVSDACSCRGHGCVRRNSLSSAELRTALTTLVARRRTSSVMAQRDREGRHYIAAWAAVRGFRQVDIVRAFADDAEPVDKSTVSRWFGGTIPIPKHLERLAVILDLDSPAALFRDPSMEWLRDFLRDRDADEQERIRKTLEAAFPRRAA